MKGPSSNNFQGDTWMSTIVDTFVTVLFCGCKCDVAWLSIAGLARQGLCPAEYGDLWPHMEQDRSGWAALGRET